MSVSLVTPTFGTTIFAKNPVVYRFRSLGAGSVPYAAAGAVASMLAGASDKFAATETMTITYEEPDGTSEAIVFTAAGTYDGEAQIPDDTYSGSISAYWEAVRAKIQAHHRIAPYFVVTKSGPIGGNRITLTARDNDAGWTITIANTGGFTNSATAPTADTTPTNYAVQVEVLFETTYKGGDYRLAATLSNVPDADGYTYFDISSVLEAECRAALSMPEVPAWDTTDSALGDNMRRFYVRFTEAYGTPVVAQEWQYDSVRTCLNGGVSQQIYAAGDWLAALDVTDAFLTWQPDGRKVGLTEPQYLTWYNWDTATRAVFVKMQWYDIADGTASTATDHLTEVSVAAGETALLPVGPEVLGLDSNADAYKYRVRVYYDDGEEHQPLSEWKTYYLDRDYYESERYVSFLNGFAAPEVLRCTGTWSKRLSVERSLASVPLLPGYNEFATEQYQYSRLFEQELTYRTGFITRAQAEALQELLIAGEIYDVSAEGYIPLRVTTNSFEVTDTYQDLHAYQFVALPRISSRNYSKKKLAAMASGAWLEPDGSSWFDTFLVAWETP